MSTVLFEELFSISFSFSVSRLVSHTLHTVPVMLTLYMSISVFSRVCLGVRFSFGLSSHPLNYSEALCWLLIKRDAVAPEGKRDSEFVHFHALSAYLRPPGSITTTGPTLTYQAEEQGPATHTHTHTHAEAVMCTVKLLMLKRQRPCTQNNKNNYCHAENC